jgi:hypothetical protein
MKRYIYYYITAVLLPTGLYSQCATDVETGTNLVKNYDFSQGYSNWTHDPQYLEFTPCGSCSSRPGYVYADTDPSKFNSVFPVIDDHTATSDNMMLMVDGLCTPGIQLWGQSNITVKPNTNYYFSVWLASIYTGTTFQGTLQLSVNGVAQAGTITPPSTTAGSWIQYEVTFNSGTNTTVDLSLENTTTSGCNNGVDFAIDDITFTPGCQFGSAGPQPDLGADRTICGTGGSITLNTGLTAVSGLDVKWNDGLSGTGTSAPVSRVITAPGTYSVCVSLSGSCVKSSVINISNTFSVNIDDALLCDPATTTLDAIYTGPGVKYKWYKNYPVRAGGNDSSRTYFVTASGTYRVDVIDPVCGTKSDVAVITSYAASPVDGTYCGAGSKANLAVTGTGKYKWCSNATGTCAKIGAGLTYTTPALTPSATYTYYVQDTSTFSMKIGPSSGTGTTASGPSIGVDATHGFTSGFSEAAGIGAGDTKGLLVFNAENDFILDSITVFVNNYHCAGGVNDSVMIEVLNASGTNIAGSPVNYGEPCTVQGDMLNARKMKVRMGLSIPVGTGYQMRVAAKSKNTIVGFLNGTNGGALPSPLRYNYPTTYNDSNGDPVVTFSANSSKDFNLYYSPTAYPGYFDWKITKGVNCKRVPVRALYVCPAPVNFIDFKAEPSAVGVNISFKTTNEAQTKKYLIQSATNMYDFVTVGEIVSLQHQAINTYDFRVHEIKEGVSYYRIVEVSQNDILKYSNTKQVTSSTKHDIRLFPNPSQDQVTLQIEEGTEAQVHVLNFNGTLMDQFTLSESPKINFGSHYAQGIYFVEIITEEDTQVLRFVKE